MAANETKNADLKARLAWITESVTSEYQSQRFATVLESMPTTNYWDYSGNASHHYSRTLTSFVRYKRDAVRHEFSRRIISLCFKSESAGRTRN